MVGNEYDDGLNQPPLAMVFFPMAPGIPTMSFLIRPLGVGAALFVTPLMSALLVGVRPTDPITYACVAVVLALVTVLATYIPARRASRVNPIVALRVK